MFNSLKLLVKNGFLSNSQEKMAKNNDFFKNQKIIRIPDLATQLNGGFMQIRNPAYDYVPEFLVRTITLVSNSKQCF